MLTQEQLDEIAARAEAATAGPWRNAEECGVMSAAEEELQIAGGMHDEDRIFIAHARTDIPSLLAHIREVEWERDEARAELSTLRETLARVKERRDEACEEVAQLKAQLETCDYILKGRVTEIVAKMTKESDHG